MDEYVHAPGSEKQLPVSDIMELYVVYDTEAKEYWTTPKGKKVWNKPNHAKNAVNANPPDWMRGKGVTGIWKNFPRDLRFSEQTRLIVKRLVFTLQEVENV